MSVTESQVQSALKEVVDPNTGKDLVTSKSAKNIRIDGNNIALDIVLGYPAKSVMAEVQALVQGKLKSIPEVGSVFVNVTSKIAPHSV